MWSAGLGRLFNLAYLPNLSYLPTLIYLATNIINVDDQNWNWSKFNGEGRGNLYLVVILKL